MIRSVLSAVVLSILVLVSAPAFATSTPVQCPSKCLLDFQGLGDLKSPGDFYNGAGFPGTPNYGVTFSSNFIGLVSYINGGSGNYSPTILTSLPNQPTIPILSALFICPGGPPYCNSGSTTGIINVSPGFSNGINFFYSAAFAPGQTETVTIWSGANGTGTVLATMTLSGNNAGCSAPAFCNWSSAGVILKQGTTGYSVTFSGPGNQLGITDITLGSSTTAIPEPSSVLLLGTGLVGISLNRIRRFLGV